MSIFTDPLSTWRLPLRFLYPANWCAKGFEADLAWIQEHPEARNAENLMSDNSGKQVWRIELPDGHGTVAYKHCGGKAPARYILHLSHPGREWRNYRAIRQMNVPAGEVLAFGETRKHLWKLETSFIITRFMSARLMLHPRYDSSVIMEGDDHAKLQFRELLSIGFAHKFR